MSSLRHGFQRLYLLFLAALAFTLVPACVRAQDLPVYKDPKADLEARVTDLAGRLTQEEKLSLLGGTGFATRGLPRLGVPPMRMADGPLGIGWVGCTVLCGGPALAATWDPRMAEYMGKIQGIEVQNRREGMQVILGPCINIHRSPLGGRNGESFSEDPYLTGVIAAGYVKGVQGTGAAACVKHFAVNNQEAGRWNIDIKVSERALREIYLPGFKAAVQEGKAWSIMDAYNQVNGAYCSANNYLLNTVLKKEWGFDGVVMSDWGAVHDTLRATLGGNDLEMPTGKFLNPGALTPLIANGQVPKAVIDDKVTRILRMVIRVGLLDGTDKAPDKSNKWEPENQRMAREAAGKAIILLKNDKAVLPLDAAALKSVAVIGSIAEKMPTSPGGSGHVNFARTINPLDALRTKMGDTVTVGYAQGYSMKGGALPAVDMSIFAPPAGTDGQGLLAEYYANKDVAGASVAKRVEDRFGFNPPAGVPRNDVSVRWSGRLTVPKTGVYTFGLNSDDGSRMFIDDKPVVDNWGDHAALFASGKVELTAGKAYPVRVEFYNAGAGAEFSVSWLPAGQGGGDPLIDAAVALAKKSDVAIICAGLTDAFEGEEHDRGNMNLPGNQDELIAAVAAANPKTIVVLFGGGPLRLTEWIGQVPAVFQAFYPGQEGAVALADLLMGEINPSGHLPDTFGKERADYNDYGLFPGNREYKDDIYVGYRHFDKKNIEPLFPFGHGLSYTTFAYSAIKVTPADLKPDGTATVTLTVKNTGKVAGEEVVQLYVHDPAPKIDRPIRELKGFTRVALKPGEAKTVALTVDARALSYCDVANKQWKADAGAYEIQIGASSRDIRLKATLTLTADWTEAVPTMAGESNPVIPNAVPTNPTNPTLPTADSDLARGKTCTVSSSEYGGTSGAGAVDGNPESRWSSKFADPQWIMVDLGEVKTVSKVVLVWENAFASAYGISLSEDGEKWTEVKTIADGKGGTEEVTFDAAKARYVRMDGKTRATGFGYSLFTFSVFEKK